MKAHFHFHSPVKAHFGRGSRKILPELLGLHERIGVVSGKKTLDKTGMRSFLDRALSDKELSFFCEIEPNPSIDSVIRGSRFMCDNKCHVIVAVGGGSSLDAAKAIATLSTNHVNFHDLIKLKTFPNQPLPMIAIPTTCGTGSEMNHYSILTDPDKKDKINFSAENTFPRHALLDPELLESLDSTLVLATAFDALTHALEGYIARKANPFTDTIALDAMKIIISTLESGQDLKSEDCLERFLYASALGGIVILHTGTTLLHSLGYYLTNHKNIHHGTANAILLPYFLKMLTARTSLKYEKLTSLFARYDFQIEKHFAQLDCPASIMEILTPEEIDLMVDYALSKTSKMENTPIPAERDFIRDILCRRW